MRVIVRIPPGSYAELAADLDRLQPRERAERLRLLSAIGLLALRGERPLGKPDMAVESEKDNDAQRRRRLKDRIGGSLE